jgi:hypothetical protein
MATLIGALAGFAGGLLGVFFVGAFARALQAAITERREKRELESGVRPALGAPATLTFRLGQAGEVEAIVAAGAWSTRILLLERDRENLIRVLSKDWNPEACLAASFIRSEVANFAMAMERRLRDLDPTLGWPPVFPRGYAGLRELLDEQVADLDAAARLSAQPSIVVTGAADVGNVAMLIGLWHRSDGVKLASRSSRGSARVQ